MDGAAKELKQKFPPELNVHNQKKLDDLKRYCSNRIITDPSMGFSITCKNCGYSLSDILNYIDLVSSKENALLLIKTCFITELPPKPDPDSGDESKPSIPPRKIRLNIPEKLTIKEYKSLLTNQLTALASAKEDERIELEIKTL